MATRRPRPTSIESHLRRALEATEDGTAKYHLREALQKVHLDGANPESARVGNTKG